MNWAIGIDMYTLMCIKWITNKNLLYKKINRILKKKQRLLDWIKIQDPTICCHNLDSKIQID